MSSKKSKTKKKEFVYSLSDAFDKRTDVIRTDYHEIELLTSHPYMKGYYLEEIIRKFLSEYLPPHFGISRGFIVDSFGHVSREIDIIIFDRYKTPIFHSSGDSRIIPVEMVYGVIEIKKNLDGRNLNDVFINLQSINKLRKGALRDAFQHTMHIDLNDIEKKFDIKRKDTETEQSLIEVKQEKGYPIFGEITDEIPIYYAVFAFQSISLNTIRKRTDSFHRKKRLDFKKRIMMVGVFDKGLILNVNQHGELQPFPSNNTKMEAFSNGRFAFKHFFGTLANYIINVNISGNIKYSDYFRVKTKRRRM
jgi:hypothetical protein